MLLRIMLFSYWSSSRIHVHPYFGYSSFSWLLFNLIWDNSHYLNNFWELQLVYCSIRRDHYAERISLKGFCFANLLISFSLAGYSPTRSSNVFPCFFWASPLIIFRSTLSIRIFCTLTYNSPFWKTIWLFVRCFLIIMCNQI